MKSSQIIAIVIGVLALLWIGSGFILKKNPKSEASAEQAMSEQPQPEDKPLMQVRVQDLTAQNYPDTIAVTGRTQASRAVGLRAEITGQIKTLLKQEGDSVSEGEKLAELEILDRQARVTEAKERVNQRQIEYNAARKLADKGFNSKVRLAQSLADLENAKAALKQSQVDLGKVTITAPFEGIISQQDIETGDYLSVGGALFSIVDLDPIELVGFVSERRVQDLQLGAQGKAEFLNGDVLSGTITYISPAANQETRTFRIILSGANPDLKIKDGLTAKIVVPVAEKLAHKISPSILALDDEGRIGVKIVNNENIVEFFPIEILSDTPDAMWIIGPPSTARFITVGQDFVGIGERVEPVQSQSEGLL